MGNPCMNAKQPWSRTDWLIVILLFLVISSLYFATTSGITSSNDGSHYALLRTIIENRSFALNQFDDYAEGNDIAITEDGQLYSDRPPGTALLGTIFYMTGNWLPRSPWDLPTRHDAGNPRLLWLMVLPAWAGAGTVFLLYTLMRELSLSRAAALTAAIMFGLGTVHWKYSSVLYSHALSAFLVILAIFLTIRMAYRQKEQRSTAFLLGIIVGFSVLVEYANALLVVILLAYLFWQYWPISIKKLLIPIGLLLAGGLISAGILAYYNNVNFGSPFRLSYTYAINYPWASSFFTTFNYPLVQGLQALLYWGPVDGWCDGTCYNQGVFLMSPILLLALPGWLTYCQKKPKECILTTGVFLVYLLLFAKHRTLHGFTADGRYLVPYLSLMAIPLGFTVAWLRSLKHHPVWQASLMFILYGLFFVSMRNVIYHIGFSYNYNLDLSLIEPIIGSIDNWQVLLRQMLPNAVNLPFLWLLESILLMLLLFFWWLFAKLSSH